MSVVDLRVKLADYDVESHTEKPLENDGETSPEKTRDDEAQRSRKSAEGIRTPNYTRKRRWLQYDTPGDEHIARP